jgi:hypothetical protein
MLAHLSVYAEERDVILGKQMVAHHNKGEQDNYLKMDIDTLKRSRRGEAFIIELDSHRQIRFVTSDLRRSKKRDSFTWIGESRDGKAKAILSVKNGIVIGTVRTEEGTYKLYPENGHTKIFRKDPSKLIPFHLDTVEVPIKKRMDTPEPKEKKNTTQQSTTTSDEPQEKSLSAQASETISSDTNVSVLVYYTQALEDKYGENTEAIIQSNFDLAKDAYVSSGTETQLQLVFIKKVADGSLLDSADATDLNDLLSKLHSDGLVRYERRIHHADAVTVFTTDASLCGLGYTPDDDENSLVDAYTAINIKPANEGEAYCSDLSFAHELGHNFGCFHDPDHVSSGAPMYSYGYGYDIENEFGTIMSYDGPEISFFSNPQKSYTNPDTGNTNSIGDDDSADNTKMIRVNRPKMADNSEQVSEVLENTDRRNGYSINGKLERTYDRDAYVLWLEGDTEFDIDNDSYDTNPFYLNVYDESTHELIDSFKDKKKELHFEKGRYRLVFSFYSDKTDSYYDLTDIKYEMNVTTEFVPYLHIPGVVQYLLD